jgi:hypothetical protein
MAYEERSKQMKTEIADKWIVALLSGEYKQAKGKLYDGEGYCCLGVLCKVLGEEFVKEEYPGVSHIWRCEGESEILPESIKEKAGMSSVSGEYSIGVECNDAQLTRDNDDGKTFKEIAAIIDEHRDEL